MARSYRRRKEELSPEAIIFGAIILFIYFVWTEIIQPTILWFERNLISIIFLIILAILIYIGIKNRNSKIKKAFGKKQIKKGLVKFVDRFENEKWGKPKEVEKWKKEDKELKEKEKLINRIFEEIKEFKPFRSYNKEFHYQVDLARHLKNKFSQAKIEKQRGSSRPDVIIDDIAIEIKGPTFSKDLRTIADKCIRYTQNFSDGLIIVLFEIRANRRMYKEWSNGLKKHYPNVKIIEK